MHTVVLTIHVLLAIGVIGLVLIQQGKGADAGAAFGSGSSATVFGAGGSGSFLTRMTTALATLFFVTSLALAVIAANRGGESDSVVDRTAPATEQADPGAAGGSSDLPADEGTSGTGAAGGESESDGDLPPIEE
ncbi:preprotein translocase subunit SecG [Halofilum ochraceum]|uniref:preprotein translocase subunit SecG n=1 Tax=Halofilum ochraceum TaxID=1611323 RepID=UPI0008D9D7E0|nr:preprotein translocase subunit SecG [Halofilum ochraceum]